MATERKALSPDVVGLELPPSTFDYEERDVMLYALGIGAKELPFIFERNLKVIPTFAVIPAFPALMGLAQNVEINPVMLLHGEQGFQIAKTIPTSGSLTTSGTVTGVYDKGKGALITIDSKTTDAAGETVFTNTSGVFIRGAGGFGGDRGPQAANKAPERAPDKSVDDTTLDIQAAIYRLSGDRNPLHVDPDFSKMAGYDRPILHGLCSFGYAGRAVLADSVTPAAPSSPNTATTTRTASPVSPSASRASSTLATRSRPRCGTRATARSSSRRRRRKAASSSATPPPRSSPRRPTREKQPKGPRLTLRAFRYPQFGRRR